MGKNKKGGKFIKSLETIAIVILIISFLVLVYCVYISVNMEKNSVPNNYQAKRTGEEIIKTNNDEINIEDITKSVVGISKIKNTGETIFLNSGSSELGLGTGFIVSENGYILTNEHVSGEKNSICYVTLEDGRRFDAKVVWSDKDIDLSIIKVNAKELGAVELGNSDSVKLAQKVYAIGNPIGFEFQRTVTCGIISGTNRTIKIEEEKKTSYMEDLIQTDATINPGNSGGPLINEKGQVIGINSVKITSAEGIGFAVPINIIKPIIEKFISEGEYTQPTLGIFAYDKNIVPYINKELGTKKSLDSGIYVTYVNANSPAEKAGIKEGDIILSVDGQIIEQMSDLRELIYSKKVGDIVKIKYSRNNRELEVEIQLTKKSWKKFIKPLKYLKKCGILDKYLI